MARSVFILGAGASKEAGVPVMKEFYDEAVRIYQEKKFSLNDEEREAFKLIIETYQNRLRILDATIKFEPALRNIETLLSLVDMGYSTSKFLGFNKDDIARFRSSLIQLVVTTIEKKTDITKETAGAIAVPPGSSKFAALIMNILRSGSNNCCVITFNYDLVLDFCLIHHPYKPTVDYCLDETPKPPDSKRPKLLKLHGSLNFVRCSDPECSGIQNIQAVPVEQYIDVWRAGTRFSLAQVTQGQRKPKCVHCGRELSASPVIVPPTWSKAQIPGIANVWHAAATELSDAKNIFILGYSLPNTDLFFKYLFALGTIDIESIDRLWVYDIDHTVEDKYASFLRGHLREKFSFRHDEWSKGMSFGNAINDLQKIGNEL